MADPAAVSRVRADLYPTRLETAEHVASLPRSVRELAGVVWTVSREAYRVMRAGADPPERLWRVVRTRFADVYEEYERSRAPFHNADPARRVVGDALRAVDGPLEGHEDLSDRLLRCAYWCCLGHPGTCSRAPVYELACAWIYDERAGCGRTPPDSIAAYWRPLRDLASAAAIAAAGSGSLETDAAVAAYLVSRSSNDRDRGVPVRRSGQTQTQTWRPGPRPGPKPASRPARETRRDAGLDGEGAYQTEL